MFMVRGEDICIITKVEAPILGVIKKIGKGVNLTLENPFKLYLANFGLKHK